LKPQVKLLKINENLEPKETRINELDLKPPDSVVGNLKISISRNKSKGNGSKLWLQKIKPELPDKWSYL